MRSSVKLKIKTVIIYLIVYPSKWSTQGSTNRDLADNSHAAHKAAALSAATTSSPRENKINK